MLKKRVTIEDVARASHVSVATVSLVMRGRTGINIETRRRVEQVARALGYQRRRTRHEHHVQRISVLINQQYFVGAELNPLYARVVTGIEDVCRRRGIRNDLRHIYTTESLVAPERILLPQQYEYNGVIGVGIHVDAQLDAYLREHNTPFVLVDVADPVSGFDTINVRYQQAIDDLVSYLVSMGHRSVALIDDQIPSLHWQYTISHALRSYGMLEPTIFVTPSVTADIQDMVYRLLQHASHASVVICRTDTLARHIINQLHHLGRYVPQSMSVVGFYDVGTMIDTPTLTTVRVDAATLGVLAVQTLLHRIEWPNTPRVTTTIDAALVIRQSTQSHMNNQ